METANIGRIRFFRVEKGSRFYIDLEDGRLLAVCPDGTILLHDVRAVIPDDRVDRFEMSPSADGYHLSVLYQSDFGPRKHPIGSINDPELAKSWIAAVNAIYERRKATTESS